MMADLLVVNMSSRILFLILRVCKKTEKKIQNRTLTAYDMMHQHSWGWRAGPLILSDVTCLIYVQTDFKLLITIFALIFLPLPLFFPAGWVLSTMISKASSSSWRGASTPTGKPTAALCPTTLNASCHSAPSTVLWVAAEGGKGWGIQKWKGTK